LLFTDPFVKLLCGIPLWYDGNLFIFFSVTFHIFARNIHQYLNGFPTTSPKNALYWLL